MAEVLIPILIVVGLIVWLRRRHILTAQRGLPYVASLLLLPLAAYNYGDWAGSGCRSDPEVGDCDLTGLASLGAGMAVFMALLILLTLIELFVRRRIENSHQRVA